MNDSAAGQPPAGRTILAEVTGLRKVYRLGNNVEVHALRGVDLRFAQGEFVAVMGASGSGKSTLLNLLGCLDRPTSGRYVLAGHDVSRLSDWSLSRVRSRYLGFIFQSYNLIPQLNLLENIAVPLSYLGAESPAGRERCIRLARLVGLGERLRHRPTELSGGQQQRAAVARALVNDPHLILADEPTGNLDTATGTEIMDLLSALNRAGRTIIMVTHESDIAARAHRTVHLRDGRVESVETREPQGSATA
jgi:putative ABC transport system ATP-binding protein